MVFLIEQQARAFFFTVFLDAYERKSLLITTVSSALLSLSLVECFGSSHYAPLLKPTRLYLGVGNSKALRRDVGVATRHQLRQSHFDLSGGETIRPLLQISHATLRPFLEYIRPKVGASDRSLIELTQLAKADHWSMSCQKI
jgi:hypothetical protein